MDTGGEQAARNLLNEKLTALSGVLRLGHEACQKGSLEAVAMHIVNNTRMLAAFDRSCLVDFRSGSPEMIAIMGVAEVNRNSEFCVNMKKMLRPFDSLSKAIVLRDEAFERIKASQSSIEAFKYFKGMNEDMILIPLLPPDKAAHAEAGVFIWVLEFRANMGTDTEKLLLLLSQMYSMAVWYSVRRRKGILSSALHGRMPFMTPGRVLLVLFALLIPLLFAVKVDLSALADFQLEPPEKTIEYAPFNGILKKSLFSNGQEVKKGDTVIEYDTESLNYDLLASQKEYDELCAQLDMVRQNSFVNGDDLAKAKLLEAKRDRKKVDIDRARRLLSKSVLKADRDGILAIEDPNLMRGRSVDAGTELYEILPPGKLIAKACLNEADASVICPDMKIKLYLHSSPATALPAKTLSVSPRPSMQENNQFCYVIKTELEGRQDNLICGMRGVARISGQRVSLGYYLFRNAMLWWRKI